MKAPFRHVKPVACGARSRAYRANCVLALGDMTAEVMP